MVNATSYDRYSSGTHIADRNKKIYTITVIQLNLHRVHTLLFHLALLVFFLGLSAGHLIQGRSQKSCKETKITAPPNECHNIPLSGRHVGLVANKDIIHFL